MSEEHQTPLDPARDYAGRWMALFWRQRVMEEHSPATRALEQRDVDRLAEELRCCAVAETPNVERRTLNAEVTEGGAA